MSMTQDTTDFKMQEIHTPSAFEGALWAATGVKDAATIFHSPPGCYINQHVNMLINDWTMELYATNLSYANVMQGAEDRLEAVMRTIITKKQPKAIFVVTAPSVEVTQDDVEGVAAKVGFKDTVVIRPPIGGAVNEGKDAALVSMLAMMESNGTKRARSVNLIGPTYSTFNWMADVCELRRMLEGIGVTVNAVLTAGSTVEELKRAPQAALNLCLYPYDCGVAAARAMEKQFGTPCLETVIPIGFENSARWLEDIAAFFKHDASPFVRAEMQSALDFARANMFFTVTFEMTAALSFDNNNTYAVGISEFFKSEAGVAVVMCSVSSERAADRIRTMCENVLLNPTIDEKRAAFVSTGPMVIFGNFYDKKISMDEGFKNFIFADIPTIGYLSTENCPFMGFRGAKYLIQALVNEVYMGIFLETKGEMEGAISGGAVPWEIEAEQALVKVAEMIPHFIRATAVKKLHQAAEQFAQERGGKVSLAIMQEVADKYTPTKFKAKFSSVFETVPGAGAPGADDDEEVPLEALAFSLAWDEDAKKMLEEVPSAFRQAAVSNTENFAREHAHPRVTLPVFEAFRKELGM
jgi:light-independent protochlorophyllide reductase B subunit